MRRLQQKLFSRNQEISAQQQLPPGESQNPSSLWNKDEASRSASVRCTVHSVYWTGPCPSKRQCNLSNRFENLLLWFMIPSFIQSVPLGRHWEEVFGGFELAHLTQTRPEEEVLSAAEKRWQAWRALSLLLFYSFIFAWFCYVFWDAFSFQKFKAAEHPRMKSTAFDAKPCVTPRGSGCVLDPESKLCWFVDDVRYSLVS